MILTSSKFLKFQTNTSLWTDKDRHLAILKYFNDNNIIFTQYNLSYDITEILYTLWFLHLDEYITQSRKSDLFSPAIEYLWLINKWIDLLESTNFCFCIWYPAWHHAEKTWSAGKWFCVFSNASFAALKMKQIYGNVLIIDFDLHQWNGTKDIIKDEKNIFLFSCHNSNLYPLYWENYDTSLINYMGYNINNPNFENWIIESIWKICHTFNSDCIILSAWFDSHINDPMRWWKFTNESYINLWKLIKKLNLPTLAILEGWYNLEIIWRLIFEFNSLFD